MTIYREIEAEIIRLYTVERWCIGTIAETVAVHHSTVTRVLKDAGIVPREHSQSETIRRRSMIDPFLGFIKETFHKYPKLAASVLHRMVSKRGYQGGEDHFRHLIATRSLRPPKFAEAFLELRTLPAEQAQVDWASFGPWPVDGGQRRLSVFVMVLSYSRMPFVRFGLDQKMTSFLEGHVEAFSFFGGVPKKVLYDNLKSAVLERVGDAKRFNPILLDLAAWYRFEPRPVGIRRGNEKGRVERLISYIRSSFFCAAEPDDLDHLNRLGLEWCTTVAAQRDWPEQRMITVRQAYEKEQQLLVPLPGDPFPCEEELDVRVGKTPYIRFDCNRYSVPHTRVRRTLTLRADSRRVRIFDGTRTVAAHPRCWDKQKLIEDAKHIDSLREAKREARLHSGQDRLLRAVPGCELLLMELSKRQRRLHRSVKQLESLLDAFGAEDLAAAIDEALASGSPGLPDVQFVLDRRRYEHEQLPPIPIDLPDDPKVRGIVVTPHELDAYDPASVEEDTQDPEQDETTSEISSADEEKRNVV